MRRVLKIAALGFVSLIGLAAVAVAAAILLVPQERVVALAADQVRAATGRELTVAGEATPSFWPVLGVRAEEVRLANAPWSDTPHMLSAGAIEIGVELLPLLSGEVRVARLRLVEPVLALEIDAEGRRNWMLEAQAAAASTADGKDGGTARELPPVALPEATVTDGRITFEDARTGQRFELAALDLTASAEGLDAPLRLKGAGLWNGERARLEALLDTPAKALAGEPAGVRVALAGAPAELSFEGDVALPADAALPQLEVRLSATIAEPAAAHAWATGAAAPAALAELGALSGEGTLALSQAAVDLTLGGNASYRGRAVRFDLTVEGGEDWADRAAGKVTLSARSVGLFELSFEGPVNAGDTLAAEGPVKLAVRDLGDVADWARGGKLPATAPSGFELAGRLAVTGGARIALEGLDLALDDTAMTGAATVDLAGARPMLTARLDSGPLDLSPFMAGRDDGKDGGGAPAAEGWSTEPLDLSALRQVDADVTVRAEAVDLGDTELGASDVAARLRDGRLDLTTERIEVYGGAVSGTLALAAGEKARVTGDLAVVDLQLRPFLAAMAGMDNLEGRGNLKLEITGQGGSIDALMRSLDGSGALDLADGTIRGVNLAALVRNLTGQGGEVLKTDFSSITGTFEIRNGVLRTDDLSLLGPLVRVTGAGRVDLGDRSQDVRLEPKAVASLAGQGGAADATGLKVFPVLVTGTWSAPRFRPDLTGAVRGLIMDPGGTVEGVTGLVKGADPGQAAGALLGRALDGAAGATAGKSSRDTGAGDTSQSGPAPPTDGLLGTLGKLTGRSGDGGDLAPPDPEGTALSLPDELAPSATPLPEPAEPHRAALDDPEARPSTALPNGEDAASPPADQGETPAPSPVEEGARTLERLFKPPRE